MTINGIIFSTSDLVQMAGILVSLLTGLIAIFISVVTLRQNNRMIENSSRPYVAIYTGITNFQSPSYYIIVKNFGQSGAYITEFFCDYDLSQYSYNENHVPFSHMSGTFLAPGQTFSCNIDPLKLFEDVHPLTFNVKYQFGEKTYKDTFILNVEADADIVHTRACSTNKELSIISYALQDIAEKML